jgi:hypothetical protein
VSWYNSLYYIYVDVSASLVAISCSAAGSVLVYIHIYSSIAVIVILRQVIIYNTFLSTGLHNRRGKTILQHVCHLSDTLKKKSALEEYMLSHQL